MSNENPAGLPSIPVKSRKDDTVKSARKVKDPRRTRRSGGMRGKGAALIAALVSGLVGFGIIFYTLLAAQPATIEAYRTSTPLAANQLVTSDNIEVVELPEAEAPSNLLTKEQLEANLWFAQVGMPAGTPLTSVVLTTKTRTDVRLPEGMVIASFEADPASAVAGKVQAGDYVNITALGRNAADQEVARTILNRIMVLDVNVNPQTIAQSAGNGVDAANLAGPNNPKVYGGIPTLYTVAVTNEQAATLALARNKSLYVTLTTADASDPLNVTVTEDQVFGSSAVPAGTTLVPDVTTTPSPTATAPEATEPTEATESMEPLEPIATATPSASPTE